MTLTAAAAFIAEQTPATLSLAAAERLLADLRSEHRPGEPVPAGDAEMIDLLTQYITAGWEGVVAQAADIDLSLATLDPAPQALVLTDGGEAFGVLLPGAVHNAWQATGDAIAALHAAGADIDTSDPSLRADVTAPNWYTAATCVAGTETHPQIATDGAAVDGAFLATQVTFSRA